MIINKTHLGRIGEDAAVTFLKQQGYNILERNFQNHIGEIDIIAYDDKTLCFIEVKTRNSDIYGSPFEAVTLSKQRKITRVALSYLQSKGKSDESARFDVIAVMVQNDECQNIEMIKDAFEAS